MNRHDLREQILVLGGVSAANLGGQSDSDPGGGGRARWRTSVIKLQLVSRRTESDSVRLSDYASVNSTANHTPVRRVTHRPSFARSTT